MYGTSLLSTPGQFGPVLLPLVSKNDDKELCFLKQFGFNTICFSMLHGRANIIVAPV
jgi:hypothetical protein